ncbi:TOBE domain-containing protein [Thermomicrobium sp. 4228-Ro]|uniref:TOBE domain-containing protein n=1 Tax=Thermomicrobium sp. 4228-Ro TaxID=2993937 RepID=UPI002B058CCF|nr:TOBE domain-containing protein [Thermomicrobium sp. 4228-Ro]
MRRELRQLQRRLGITFIHVTHNQEEALAIADRIVVMNSGRIEQIDSPPAIYNRPATLFVARFMGDNNIIPATVSNVIGSRIELRHGDLVLESHTPVPTPSPGTHVHAVIPAAHVRVEPATTPTRTNALKARLIFVEYLGDVTKLFFSHPSVGELLVKTFSSPTYSDADIGNEFWLTWEGHYVHILRAD